MRDRGWPPRLRGVGFVGLGTLLVLAGFAVAAQATKSKRKPKLPNVVYIRFQLSETFQRISPSTGTDKLIATLDVVQAVTPADLRRDSIVPALRVISSSLNAEVPDGSGGTCSYTGALTHHGAPLIMLKHAHHKTYGFVSWPDQAEGSYTQRPHPLNAPSCPSSALLTPPEGPVASSPSVGGFTATQRFDNAIFPIVVPRGQRKIKVKMSSFGNIPGETDQTHATGLVTVSYGRCPSGLKKCKPTNGKP